MTWGPGGAMAIENGLFGIVDLHKVKIWKKQW